jgi:DNA-binding NtrC family response regulator
MILIVDDDYDIASLVRISLKKVGHYAASFTDSFAALEEFKRKPFDYEVVISDIRMPSMNGYEFVKQVKLLNSRVR